MTRDLYNLFDELSTNGSTIVSDESSLSDITPDESEQDFLIRQSDRLLETELRVDYSDFANHVFFNSAEDYFTITAERILNEFPVGGTRDDVLAFDAELDGYQRYVLSNWPSRTGHLRFQPTVSSSYVQVDDIGVSDGVMRSSMLSPGTGSLAIEVWYNSHRVLTGSEDVSFLVHKHTPESPVMGYSLFLTGSNICFRITSGSNSFQTISPASVRSDGYVLAVMDRTETTGTLTIYTGSMGMYPVAVSSASVTLGAELRAASASLYMGSGSITGKNQVPYSGTLDDVRVWNLPLGLADVTSSFNRKSYARGGLVGAWRFNETGSSGIQGLDSIVRDHSGHALDGRIRNYWYGVRGSGSISFDSPDPILDIRCPEVYSYVLEQQTSGSQHDRNNPSKITDLLPDAFVNLESDQDSETVKNFLYILGRHYDRLKLFAEHLQYMLRVNYSGYNDVPDSKLEDMARFFGWTLPGSFNTAPALQYLVGRGVQVNELSNEEIESKLYEIKVQIWRQILNNLPHIYKTKGTRESVKAILNSYGLNDKIVRLKEYGFTNRSKLEAQRIPGQMSSHAIQFGSGSLTGSVYASFYSGTLVVTPSSSLNLIASSSYIQMEQMAQSFPSSSAEFFTLTGARPVYIWNMQEPSGTGIVDSVAGQRLGTSTTTALRTGGTASGFWYNGSFTGKKCVDFAGHDAAGVLSGSNTTLCDVSTGSFAHMIVFRMPQSGTSAAGLFGKYDSTKDVGYYFSVNDGSRFYMVVRDSVPGYVEVRTSASFFDDWAWHVALFGWSKVSGTGVIACDQEFSSAAAPLVTGSISTAVPFRIGEPSSPVGFGVKMQVAYEAFFTGSDAETMMASKASALRNSFWKHASASAGLEYNQSAYGTFFTEVGNDEYGKLLAPYASSIGGRDFVRQVPYVYSSGFSGSQGVGLLAVPSYINYIIWPSNTSAWTHVSASTSPGTPSTGISVSSWKLSPWRTYSTSVTTGSAVNARVYTDTSGGLVSNWYCASSYLRADVAHTCTIELQDTSGNTISSKNVAVTTLWDRYFVSGVLPAGSSSLRYAVYIGQKGVDSSQYLCVDGAQINEGTYPLPLLANVWWGNPNAGQIPRSTPVTGTYISMALDQNQVPPAAGRIDVLYSTFGQEGISGSMPGRFSPIDRRRALVDVHAGTSDVNRKVLFIESGSSPRMGAILRDNTTAYETVMTASTAFTGAKTAVFAWNQTESGIPNTRVENAGLSQSTSQSFTPGTTRVTKLFVGHLSASSDTSGSSHLYGAISRITMYSGSYVSTSSMVESQSGHVVSEFSVETRVLWPTSGNMAMSASQPSGSLWSLKFRDEDSCDHHLKWTRTSDNGKTGSLVMTVGSASISLTGLPIFNDLWHNVCVVKENATGSYTFRVSRTDGEEIVYSTSSMVYSTEMTSPSFRQTGSITRVTVGSTGSVYAQQWMDEFRLWTKPLTVAETEDHCLNYRSYGTDRYRDVKDDLFLHWRMDENVSASAGTLYVLDHSLNNRHGTGSFVTGLNPYRNFLNGYSYIASPEYGWTDNKVRVYDGRTIDPLERPVDSRLLSLEFNLTDQLNEEISQMMDSFEELNDVLGHPASQYRGNYSGLDGMRRAYFRRMMDRLNFRVFVDMIDLFDRSFVEAIRRVVPARSIFLGDEVVVESHMLERARVGYSRRVIKDSVPTFTAILKVLRR